MEVGYLKQIADAAILCIGYGYIYGATGWICTPARVEQQAEQYPDYAEAIRKYGLGKWAGKRCYDCAQLTKAAAKAAGISIPSGATSQWKADIWEEKGSIESLPRDMAGIFLYRESGGKMQHTGVYLGDGTFVDSRGHEYGVLRTALSKYAWTHWARLRGTVTLPASPAGESGVPAMVDAAASAGSAQTTLELQPGQAQVTGSGDLRLRKQPNTSASVIKGMSQGTVVKVLERVPNWARVEFVDTHSMVHIGWCMDIYLIFG